MKQIIKSYPDNPAVASAFAKELVHLVSELAKSKQQINIALSGGSTPKLLFEVLSKEYSETMDWERIHLFWGDERCVKPDSPESNFGEADRILLSQVDIPAENIHRVHGESEPADEATRYEQVIKQQVPSNESGTPRFDIVLLGMGSDGHTASIFPHEIDLFHSENICEVATHPESGQKRITITGKVINAATNVCFLITGDSKAEVLAEILDEKPGFEQYPTSLVKPNIPATFYIDESAASAM